MPTLNWIGKEKVVNHHQDVPYKILEKQYTYTDGKESSTGSSDNKIIHGDNLEALKSLLPEYEGKIDCIYIDPPYNTGNEGWVYNDNVSHPRLKKWLGEVVGKEGEDLSRHDKWLCMMYPRLKLLQKLLSSNGAIFISLDDNEQAHLKLLCDEIFGQRNFIANIIWQKKTGASDSNNIANVTEYILVYAKKSTNLSFNQNDNAYDKKRYRFEDEYLETRGPFYYDSLDRGTLGYYESLDYKVETPDGNFTYPNGRKVQINDGWRWKWGEEKLRWGIENGFIETRKSKSKKSGWGVYYKIYLNVDNEGKLIKRSSPFKNIILDVLNTHASNEAKQLFDTTTLFSNPKPVELIKKILNLIKNKNAIVLDSFAGSGTTAHAVSNLNKEDGGNRKFILVEMEDYAQDITAERVKRVIDGYGKDKKAVEGTGGDFSYYELGKPLFNDDNLLNEDVELTKILEYVWYSETKTSYKFTDEEFLLGTKEDVAYYFYYTKNSVTTLDMDFLRQIKTKASSYIIYADNCLLDKDIMDKYHIIFKKIPRDISRF